MTENQQRIIRLSQGEILEKGELAALLGSYTPEERQFAADLARETATRQFGKQIYFRGLIEFTNYCKNDCLYCGIRRSNKNASRYRMELSQVLDCCRWGYSQGFRTFVLQGGEDP